MTGKRDASLGKGWRPSFGPDAREQLDDFERRSQEHLEERFGAHPFLAARYFDRNGDPMTLADFCEAYQDVNYCVVASSVVGRLLVSTVWVGVDQEPSLDAESPPLIFETVVLDESPEGMEQPEEIEGRPGLLPFPRHGVELHRDRYTTEQAALQGHREAVAAAEAGLTRKG